LFALRLQAPEEMRNRLFVLLLVDQDAAEVKPRERIVRPVRDGCAETLGGVIEATPLFFDDAKIAVRLRVVWIDLQGAAVCPFGLSIFFFVKEPF
jgi:hypothetical protein